MKRQQLHDGADLLYYFHFWPFSFLFVLTQANMSLIMSFLIQFIILSLLTSRFVKQTI